MSNQNQGDQHNMSPDRNKEGQQGNFKNDPKRAGEGDKKENNQGQPKGY